MLWGRRGRMWWRGGKGPKSHTQRNTLHPSVKTLDTNKIPYYSLTKNWYMTLSSSSMSTNCVLKTMPLTHPPPLSLSSRATTNTIPYPLKHAHKDPVHQPPTREIVELCNKNYYVSLLWYFSVNSPNLRELISILSVEQVADVCCPA